MGKGVYGAIMKMLRAENLPCTVTKVWMLSPTMKAVRVSSPDFIRTHRPAEGEYLRCWFPHPDRPAKESMRGYTLTDVDYETGEFTLLFLLHQPAGPASSWVGNAKLATVSMPRIMAQHLLQSPNQPRKGLCSSPMLLASPTSTR